MELHKVLSWNINSMNSPQKHNRTFLFLEKQKCDPICFQETHITLKDQHLLSQQKLGRLYQSSAETKQKGVAIYVKSALH